MEEGIRQLCEDLKQFENPQDAGKALSDSLIGATEACKEFGAVNSIKEIKKECGLWRIFPYWIIPRKIRAKAILKLAIERNK